VIVSLWLLVGIFIGYLLVILWHAHQTEVNKVRLQALAQTRLVAEHATSHFDRVNLLLLGVEEHLGATDFRNAKGLSLKRRVELQQVLVKHLNRLPGVVSITIADAEGRVIVSSIDSSPDSSLSDRNYFQTLKSQRSNAPLISGPLKGRLTGKWGILEARRIEFPDGSFAGVMVANLGIAETFDAFYKTVGIEPNMFITLRDSENRILVRHPIIEDKINTVVSGSSFAISVLKGDEENIVTSLSPIDHIERIVALRKLDGYPVFAAVGLSKDDALAPWHQQLRVALFVIVGVIMAAAFSHYAILRRDRASRELEAAHLDLKDAHLQLDGVRQELEVSNARLSELLQQSEQNASHDELTGLWNRRMLNHRLEETIIRSRRLGVPFCLLMFDLDHFKRINDDYGHLVGDEVLREFAQVIKNRIRENDFLARWGGEEFVLILEATDVSRATVLAEELREAIFHHRFETVGALTVSIGLAECSPDDGANELLRRADQSLYFAKIEGRNRVNAGSSETLKS
jgi:diguanylate cyclase (GGDEF)-like protein